ncbi:MAG: hypothetical protein JWN33_36 [Candidatus Saccharibacteria bacterium]|nr:hypothetical protein [Candidatus Saccharibacteria bacterium]
MLTWLKLSHHSHSGKIRPHEHTSYLLLGVILLVVGFSLLVYTSAAVSPGPEAGSIGLSGSMPGKPPTTAAVIQTPTNQQNFGESPVIVAGTCPANTLVEIFKNDIFAGSFPCSSEGTFSLNVDLLFGQNTLLARVYDDLNQPGPDSNAVTVFYNALPPQADPLSGLNFGGEQLLLTTDAVFRGTFPEQDLSIPVGIIGGSPPYAVNVQWGDTKNTVIPRNNNTPFSASHAYTRAGSYQVSIQASDAAGRIAFLTVASIVNGQPSALGAVAPEVKSDIVSKLLVLWPLYAATFSVVLSFWLGERREKRILGKSGQLLPPVQPL